MELTVIKIFFKKYTAHSSREVRDRRKLTYMRGYCRLLLHTLSTIIIGDNRVRIMCVRPIAACAVCPRTFVQVSASCLARKFP